MDTAPECEEWKLRRISSGCMACLSDDAKDAAGDLSSSGGLATPFPNIANMVMVTDSSILLDSPASLVDILSEEERSDQSGCGG